MFVLEHADDMRLLNNKVSIICIGKKILDYQLPHFLD